MDIGLVFMHGAGLGEWVWDGVVAELEQPCLKVSFPEPLEDATRSGLTLADYSSHAEEQIKAWGQTANHIIVAHSLAGVIGLELASRMSSVKGFLGVSAATPKDQGSFLSTLPQPQKLLIGTMMKFLGTKPPDKAIEKSLCEGLDAAQTSRVIDSWISESIHVYKDRTTNKLDCPTGYVVTMKDKEFSQKQMKQMASNLTGAELFQIESGHMPMLQRPSELAKIIGTFVETIEPQK